MQLIKCPQQTDEWFFHRKGKITGTRLKDICGTPKKKQDTLYEVLGERLSTGLNDKSENPMDRGNRLEDEARAQFQFITGKKVDTSVGLATREDNQFIAFSPDGIIISDDGIIREHIEIKCPESKNYVKYWLNNSYEDYEEQVIQNFIVNDDLEKLYFVIYCPEITIHPIHIIEIERSSLESKIESYKFQENQFLSLVEEKLQELIK